MKRILFLLSLVTALSFGFSNEASAQVTVYSRVDTYNSSGVNANDFIFSYDTYQDCFNNVKVINNLNVRVNFSFNIYLGGSLAMTGKVNLAPGGSYFFDDAFLDCNSSVKAIEISCW